MLSFSKSLRLPAATDVVHGSRRLHIARFSRAITVDMAALLLFFAA
jgi:hypothetical protein